MKTYRINFKHENGDSINTKVRGLDVQDATMKARELFNEKTWKLLQMVKAYQVKNTTELPI